MHRIAAYFILWLTGIATTLILRFSRFAGTDSDARVPLVLGAMLFTGVFFATANVYEMRRVILKAGLRGSRTFGYVRGWIKSFGPEFALDDSQLSAKVAKEYRAFRLGSMYAFFSLIVIIPVLLF